MVGALRVAVCDPVCSFGCAAIAFPNLVSCRIGPQPDIVASHDLTVVDEVKLTLILEDENVIDCAGSLC